MTGTSAKVVVVGGTYVDMAVRCSEIPAPGQCVPGSGFSYTATGPGPNQAAEASLCGCDVWLVSKIGEDPFAQMVRESLSQFKVNTDYIRTAQAKSTGVVMTFVNAAGGNGSCMCCGANGALTAQDIDAADAIISEADVCLIHGQLPDEAVIRSIGLAKVHGTKVILNPAAPIESPEQDSSSLPAEYFTVDILLANLYEAARMAEQSDAGLRTAKLIGSDLVAHGVGAAIITMGKRGCMVIDRSAADHVPAFEVESVDHTARGDAFAGALAAYCAVKDDVREAAKFASAAGALACTKFGSIESMPAKDEIIQLLQREDEFTE